MKTTCCAHLFLIVKSVILVILITGCTKSEIILEVYNSDTIPIDSLSIKVTGNDYTINRIKPGESIKTIINVTGESSILLITQHGIEFPVEVYLEPYYDGLIKAEIKSDSLISVDADVSIY